jgi:hypothetical protein
MFTGDATSSRHATREQLKLEIAVTNSGVNVTAVNTPIQGALERPINDSNSFS